MEVEEAGPETVVDVAVPVPAYVVMIPLLSTLRILLAELSDTKTFPLLSPVSALSEVPSVAEVAGPLSPVLPLVLTVPANTLAVFADGTSLRMMYELVSMTYTLPPLSPQIPAGAMKVALVSVVPLLVEQLPVP